jgi:hypothetical protein
MGTSAEPPGETTIGQTAQIGGRRRDLVTVRIWNDCGADLIGLGHLTSASVRLGHGESRNFRIGDEHGNDSARDVPATDDSAPWEPRSIPLVDPKAAI